MTDRLSNSVRVGEGRSRPRLLFVVNVDWFFLSHRLPIAVEALRQGYDVHLACSVTGRTAEIEAAGVTVHPLAIDRRAMSPLAAIRTFWAILALLRRLRPDIVHLVTIKPVLLGGIAARLAGIRHVVAAVSGLGYIFIAGGQRARWRRGIVRLLYRFALGSPRVIAIFQNQSDAEEVRAMVRLDDRQVRLVKGSGVDLDRFTPKTLLDGDTVLTFAARLLVDKGIREFVAAAGRLKAEGAKARFLVAGDPDPGNPVFVGREEVESWRSGGVVELVGHVDDMDSLFARSHVVVLPSYREGLPKVLAEAAGAGRAVITTDVPGCRDAVIPDETALVVPCRSVDDLAGAMRILIDDRDLCRQLGEAGRRLAECEFDLRSIVQAHLDLYAELTAAQPRIEQARDRSADRPPIADERLKVVVTGATGFVGSALCRRLAEDGTEVVAAVRRTVASAQPGVRYVGDCDLGVGSGWEAALKGADVVVHAAARVHRMNETSDAFLGQYWRDNVDATLALARSAAAAGVKRFLFISSIKVNGEQTEPGRPFRPDDPADPADAYGRSKYEAEQQLFELGRSSGLEIVVVRSPLVYGPGVTGNFRSMLRAVASGIPLPLGSVESRRSLIALDNLVDLLALCVRHPAAAGNVFLASDGEDVSLSELLRRLGAALGRPARLWSVPPAVLRSLARLFGREDLSLRLLSPLQIDSSATRRTLGWSPPITVDEGLKRSADAYRAESGR